MTPLPKLQVTKSSLPPPVHSGPIILFYERHTKKNEEDGKEQEGGKAEGVIKTSLRDDLSWQTHLSHQTHCSHWGHLCLHTEYISEIFLLNKTFQESHLACVFSDQQRPYRSLRFTP